MVKVSVIIPAFNEEDVIGICVDSILKNKFKDMEIIVVDDGSKDNTAKIVRAIKDDRVKLISLKKNSGAARARNVGIKRAKGDVIILTDADCSVSEKWISEHLNGLEKYDYVLGSSSPTSVGDNMISKSFYLIAIEKWGRIDGVIMSAITANGSFHRKIFKNIKFDESFKTAAYEDKDFMLMLDEAGFKRGYNAKANIKHLFHETIRGHLKRAFKSAGAFNVFTRKHRTKKRTTLQMTSIISTLVFPLLLPVSFLLSLRDIKYFIKVSKRSGWKFLPFLLAFDTMRNFLFMIGITYYLIVER